MDFGLDYATLTTFSYSEFNKCLGVYGISSGEGEEYRINGYDGNLVTLDDGSRTFYGQGKQKGVDHYMVACNGLWSNNLWDCGLAMKCTRLDLRIDTLLELDTAKLRALALAYGRKFQITESANDGFTAYIGARTSDKFIRVYNKSAQLKAKGRANLGNVRWRLELEVKRDTAPLVWDFIRHNQVTKCYWYLLSEFKKKGLDGVIQFPTNTPDVRVSLPKRDDGINWSWLEGVVAAYCAKAVDCDFSKTTKIFSAYGLELTTSRPDYSGDEKLGAESY